MFITMLFTLPIIIVGQIQADNAFEILIESEEPIYALPEFYTQYHRAMRTFGILSGTFFMILGIAMLVMF